MTVSELLEAIRTPYVRLLSEAVQRQPAHIEPAYRQADGTLAVEGALELPYRADFISIEGSQSESTRVDSTVQFQFEAVSFEIDRTSIALSPFTWDWAPVEVVGLGGQSTVRVLYEWFFRWFDAEDTNSKTDEGLYGVIHFMSEPEQTERGVRVDVDLGSAPAEAVEDLMLRMSDAGAAVLRVG